MKRCMFGTVINIHKQLLFLLQLIIIKHKFNKNLWYLIDKTYIINGLAQWKTIKSK